MVRRNREELQSFTFADYMERLLFEIKDFWRENLHEHFFLFLEKRARGARIMFLRLESWLFKTTNRLRGFKDKNGTNGNGNNHLPP